MVRDSASADCCDDSASAGTSAAATPAAAATTGTAAACSGSAAVGSAAVGSSTLAAATFGDCGGASPVPTMKATVFPRIKLYVLSNARIICFVDEDSLVQCPSTVSSQLHRSTGITSCSTDPPSCIIRVRMAKPMSWSLHRKIQLRVCPGLTRTGKVWVLRLGTLISSAPLTLISFHSSLAAVPARVAVALPAHPPWRLSRARCRRTLPTSHACLLASLRVSACCCTYCVPSSSLCRATSTARSTFAAVSGYFSWATSTNLADLRRAASASSWVVSTRRCCRDPGAPSAGASGLASAGASWGPASSVRSGLVPVGVGGADDSSSIAAAAK
mmetsp:Transcript_2912/g.6610  ORF Transcript_2912/g.6610 Transcript_2912/m.6610 type:complete len:330 (+) Transcript_2912:249-1238(+)